MSKIIKLNCESIDSTIAGFSQIFDIPPESITNYFCSLTSNNFPTASPDISFKDYLHKGFVKKFGQPKATFKPYAFHITRKFDDEDYAEGLLSTERVFDKLFKRLCDISQLLNIHKPCREKLSLDPKIMHKKKLRRDGGPWGFVILDIGRESHFCRPMRSPEIVIDMIKASYQGKNLEKINSYIKEHTFPCALKFLSHEISHAENLSWISHYIYHKTNNIKTCRDSGFNINMNGFSPVEIEKVISL